MDERLPEELTGHAAAIPHPEHVERVEFWTDRLLQALSGNREQPATARHWLKPTEELSAHVRRVVFAPTPGEASVELLVGGADERPVTRVDGNFCAWPDGEDDDSSPRRSSKRCWMTASPFLMHRSVTFPVNRCGLGGSRTPTGGGGSSTRAS